VLEGVALGVRHNLEALGEQPRRVVAVGGGSEGGLWTQIVSDACGVRQELPRETIGASYGDALLAGQGVGLVDGAVRWARPDRTVEPASDRRASYDELYRLYRELYPATREVAHALAARQEAQA